MKSYQSFTLLISSIYRSIYKIKDKEMSALGLKGTHLTCLFYLHEYGSGQTAADLCKLSGEDKAAISRSIEYLVGSGYIEPGEGNYRRPLKLTPKGEETARYISSKVDDFVAHASKDLTDEERLILYKALGKVESKLRLDLEEEG
ncbi:MAG: winged helix-turn-helix transcriptional regulator [Clostridiales bacterium]|nr:winged helix-turn-helix transcriptional regulator [Clostridiales bacterium]